MQNNLQSRLTQFMIAMIFLAVIVCTLVAIITVNWQLRYDLSNELETFVAARGERVEHHFVDIEDAQLSATETFRNNLIHLTDEEISEGLDRYFPLQPDGSRRSSDELFDGIYIQGTGQAYGLGGLMYSGGEQSARRDRVFYAAFMTLLRHGPANVHSLESLWFFSPDNDLIIFAPNRTDQLTFYRHEADDEFLVTEQSVAQLSTLEANPEGATRCTPLTHAAYDQTGETLVTGCQSPVRIDGEQIAVFGTTLPVEEVMSFAFGDTLTEDTELFFIDSDGHMIAHEGLIIDMHVTPEELNSLETRILPDELIQRFTAEGEDSGVIFRDPDDLMSEAVAFYHLEMPGWYLALSTPKETLLFASLQQVTPIVLLGFLIGAIGLVFMVLYVRRIAIRPVHALATSFDMSRKDSNNIASEVEPLLKREDEIGDLARTLTIYKERTDAHLSELEQKVAERTLKLHVANETKSTFLATMSHELRTPMNGILGVAGALRCSDLDEEQIEMVDLIHQSSEVLERQLSDILDISKVEAGRMELVPGAVDIAHCLKDLCDFHRHTARAKNLDLKVEIDDAVKGYFLADEIRFKQVLNNLISNAIKFTQSGGITVSMSGGAVQRNHFRLIFQVIDTGVGMTNDALKHIFEPYSQPTRQLAEPNRGTGLGLTIAKSLVELMGGEISAQSTQGTGSRFILELPMTRCETAKLRDLPDAEALMSAAKDIKGGTKILLAEDHPVNQRVVQLILQPFGLKPDIVENGKAALEACETTKYDIILMDIRMPEMDGLEATRAIRELEERRDEAHTPIIILSANAMADHKDAAIEAGADIHVGKPVTPERLINAIRDMLIASRRNVNAAE